MRCLRCGTCCQETDMLLSAEDISRLERKGYRRDFFARFDKEGFALLRNRQGRCVFYDPGKRGCDVYVSRPEGCRVYPVIYDEEKGIIVDDICHAQATITESEKNSRGRKVRKLLDRIDSQARKRISG